MIVMNILRIGNNMKESSGIYQSTINNGIFVIFGGKIALSINNASKDPEPNARPTPWNRFAKTSGTAELENKVVI